METEEEQAAEAYRSSLTELHSTSKPLIDGLTMLAKDYKGYAIRIAACIERQLEEADKNNKPILLPILYLIDSICKDNPKSIYVQLFTQNIVSNFCKVFKSSNEQARRSLHKLRLTWNAIFPLQKLHAIDERIHEMDPNWPILQKETTQQRQQPSSPSQNQSQPQPQPQQVRSKPPPSSNPAEITGSKRFKNNSQSNGRRKQVKLTHNRNNNQPDEPVLAPAPQTLMDPSIIQASHDLPQVLPTNYMDPSIIIVPNDPLHQIPAATYPNLIIAPNEPQLQTPAPPPPLICTQYSQAPIQAQTQEIRPTQLSVLDSLYGGKQCSNCSLRFDDNNRYAIHLDWHFRQNQKSDNMFARRKWYYPLNLWVQFREINDDDLQDNNNADSNSNDLIIPVNDHEVPTAPASKDDEKNICSVCHEMFEKFWAEEEEEWRLKNAKLYEDERVYHPLCLMDMLQASVA